jgi:hypothetical protein
MVELELWCSYKFEANFRIFHYENKYDAEIVQTNYEIKNLVQLSFQNNVVLRPTSSNATVMVRCRIFGGWAGSELGVYYFMMNSRHISF